MVRLRWYLTDLTAASHLPPKLGAAGGMKFQEVPSLRRIRVRLICSSVAKVKRRLRVDSAS